MHVTPTALLTATTRFPAMGSDVHVVVVDAPASLVSDASARIQDLERRWSRFLPDSDLNRVNRSNGRPVRVSRDTRVAIEAAVDAWRATDGRFDPTVHAALVASGYDRDFATLRDGSPTGTRDAGPAPGCGAVAVDPIVDAVTLPPGVALDLGGIGKGLAADLVVDELVAAGAAGACVNVGGDLRVAGIPPGPDGWVVDVEPMPDVRVALADGAVATSSTAKRRWTRGGRRFHHLVDPRHGRPTSGGLAAVTVIAGSAARAEMLTKAAFVAGSDAAPALLAQAGATGLLRSDDGTVRHLAGIGPYLR